MAKVQDRLATANRFERERRRAFGFGGTLVARRLGTVDPSALLGAARFGLAS
jgi:hypothetical protein